MTLRSLFLLMLVAAVAACSNPSGPLLAEVTGSTDTMDAAGDAFVADASAADHTFTDQTIPDTMAETVADTVLPDDAIEPDVCEPSCDGLECGDDGCGGECGTCPGVAPLCVDGLCQLDCTPECEGKECGDDGCGGECGTCPGAAPICDAGICKIDCTPDCEGKDCGSDGCLGACGECGEGQFCNNGLCADECVSDEGCFEAGLATCVDSGVGLVICTEVEPGCLQWSPVAACNDGFECIDAVCVEICKPACQDVACGDDGCGGSCGQCEDGYYCNDGACQEVCVPDETCEEEGQTECTEAGELRECGEVEPDCLKWLEPVPCDDGFACVDGDCVEICVPNCVGFECGDDGCGGSCGSCGDNQTCTDGLCSCDFEACGDVCCDEGLVCDEGACVEPCVPACDGLECGEDGCGGSCGDCGANESCEEGQCWCQFVACADVCCAEGLVCENGACVEPCVPACDGFECGDDGCGGSCGQCKAYEQCSDQGQCLNLCELACEGKACGSDGCGGSCGECAAGEICTDLGACVEECLPLCLGKQCGSDGCGGSCGSCIGGQYCNDGLCTQECEPDCFLKECGDDGCGGSCGTCQNGVLCTASGGCGGECLECNGDAGCADIDFAGGTLASWNIDAAVILSSLGQTQAPTGGKMLKLTTGEGLTETDSAVHFQTCLEPGSWGVIVDWKFYSEEFKEWCGSNYQDSFHFWLETPDGNIDVADLTIKDLCEPSACNDCGDFYLGLEASDVSFDQGGVFNTPWAISTAGFSLAENTVVTLHVEFADAGDAIYDSVLLIDRIQFVSCDDFCGQLDCGAEPVCQCAACPAGVDCFQGECCVPDCDGKSCGDDGCGGLCGKCDGVCLDGDCCIPDCAGKECGDDGCGGNCGACAGIEDTCVEGQCVCVPDCDGKDCGSDGCGGSCGTCDDGLDCSIDSCDDAGQCQFDTGDCCQSNDDCDDGQECTVDTCVDGACQNAIDLNCCEPNVFLADFEGDELAGWTVTPAVEGVGWSLWSQQGDGLLYYGNTETHNFDNGQTNSGLATTPSIDLPEGVGYTLSFDVFMDVETSVSFDQLNVYAVVNGQGELKLWDRIDYDEMGQWQTVLLDLSGLAGNSLQIRFEFNSGDAWNNEGLGALIDDVTLVSTCAESNCEAETDCLTDVPGITAECVDGLCVFSDVVTCDNATQCNDQDACTADSCAPEGYCINAVQDGCCYEDLDCQDNDPCTVDECVAPVWFGYASCSNSAISGCCLVDDDCNDGNDCTLDSCPGAGEQCANVAVEGCCNGPSDCDDGNECTLGSCVNNECAQIDVCCEADVDCDDESDCTDDSCVDGGCVFTPNNGNGCCVASLFADDFSTDKGWTYQGDWERGEAHPSPELVSFNPDPAADHSSSGDNMLVGYRVGANTDKTLHNAHYLTSPVIDLSSAVSPMLTLWRYLNSDYPPYMTNSIEAFNGQAWVSLWTQQGAGFITDEAWTREEYDLTAHKNAAFQLRIGVAVGSSSVYPCPSWSVDDVMIVDAEKLVDAALCCSQFSDCLGPVETALACSGGACQ